MENDKNDSKSVIKIVVVTIFSFFFFITNALLLIAPSILSYSLGINYKRGVYYGLSHIHNLLSITIGEVLFFVLISFIATFGIVFHNPKTVWIIIALTFLLNYLLSLLFYYLGVQKTK